MTERLAYLHCKPDGTPFYVGKGSSRRAKNLGERNPHHRSIVEKYGRSNILTATLACSDSETAYALEEGLIRCLRRMGVPLANYTAGGDGGRDPRPETRKRLSDAAKARGVSEACRRASAEVKCGRPMSPEHKEKQRKAMAGRVFTEAHRKNISESAKRRGMSQHTLEKAWEANRGRVRPEAERRKRAATLRATLSAKRLVQETQA